MSDWKKAFMEWERENVNDDISIKGHEEYFKNERRLVASVVFRNLYERQILPLKEKLKDLTT